MNVATNPPNKHANALVTLNNSEDIVSKLTIPAAALLALDSIIPARIIAAALLIVMLYALAGLNSIAITTIV